MGIDDVIRKYAPKPRIELECTGTQTGPAGEDIPCGAVGEDVRLRRSFYRDAEAVLCERCFQRWC